MPVLVPIVEGDGDEVAVPTLLRKILASKEAFDWTVAKSIRADNVGRLYKKMDSFIQYARNRPACSAILILLDLDDGCPMCKARTLAARARALNSPVPVSVTLAHREYEAWFLASIPTLGGRCDLPEGLLYEGEVEARRDAKGWLTEQMPRGRGYSETMDVASLTDGIDLDLVHQRSRSFRRLLHAVDELVAAVASNAGSGYVTPR